MLLCKLLRCGKLDYEHYCRIVHKIIMMLVSKIKLIKTGEIQLKFLICFYVILLGKRTPAITLQKILFIRQKYWLWSWSITICGFLKSIQNIFLLTTTMQTIKDFLSIFCLSSQILASKIMSKYVRTFEML